MFCCCIGWDNAPYSVANYSLAVTIESINHDIQVYNEISNAVKLDIETETQIENELKL